MFKPNLTLTKDEIEEELVNNDLLSSGSIENDIVLNKMNLEEKKDLLRRINQSKDFQNESSTSLLDRSALDNSIASFPSLPVTGKNNSEKKLKLPRTQLSMAKATDSEDNQNDSVFLDNKFNLPNCLDDGALPLPLPERSTRHLRTPYCVLKGESPAVALRRMIADHESWKAAYFAEITKMDSHGPGKNAEECNSKEQRYSPKHGTEEDDDNDPYYFDPKASVQLTKVYSGPRKRETNVSSNETVTQNNRKPRTIQRKASRDSDCEEVEPSLKPADPNLGEWIQAPSQKTKRNRKRSNNQEKGRPKSVDEIADVEFGFGNKWDGQSSGWTGPQSPSLSSLNNQIRTRRNLSNTPEVQEQMVECPICQKRFPQSKVENHAATCEGFSDSPMEIEEN